MEKQQPTHKDQPEHKPIDPGRSAARESRTPGKDYKPRRSEADSSQHRDDAEREKH
jgi:hypothetical protein